MPRWRICDDDYFWFISFTERDYNDITHTWNYADINLWPCRKCGAMVMGSMRTQHSEFHKRYPMDSSPLPH